jgi:hypothetical protein
MFYNGEMNENCKCIRCSHFDINYNGKKYNGAGLRIYVSCTIKHFTIVIQNVVLAASTFVTATLFHPSLVFAIKAVINPLSLI